MFLLGIRTKKSLSKPNEVESINPIKEEETSIFKPVQKEPIQPEKFHTFDNITFMYHANSGKIYDGCYCSKHHVQMLAKEKRAMGMRYSIIEFKCRLCKEHFEVDVVTLDAIHTNFQVILQAYIKGHLTELPIRSDT